MTIDMIKRYFDSIHSRCNDAQKLIRTADTKWETDEVFADLLRKADSAVDDLAIYVEEVPQA